MSWFSVLLPIWIIGAPLVYAVFDWMSTSKSTSAMGVPRPVDSLRNPSAPL